MVPRRKGTPSWRAVRSRTCISRRSGPGAVPPCRGRAPGRGPVRTARGHARSCPERVARRYASPRRGAHRPAVRLARLPGTVPVHRPPRDSLWRRALIFVVVTNLVLVFLVLVVYLGRHAGT